MNVSRARALAWIAAGAGMAACGSRGGAVRVGSKNFTESFVIAEIYAQSLERAGLRVDRRFNLGLTQIALAAMHRGDIDLYPEYTGTALIDVLHLAPIENPATLYATVAREFSRRFDLVWLKPSPMNDSQALATTSTIARREHIRTLSDLAPKAARLRLATIQEFLSRPDGLPGLQRVYGGFKFADVRTYDIALKYQALLSGKADVASAFTTDGAIASENFGRSARRPPPVAALQRRAGRAQGDARRPAADRTRARRRRTRHHRPRRPANERGGRGRPGSGRRCSGLPAEHRALSGAAIRFDRVRVAYPGADRAAVDDVSFEVAPGELVVLLGPSGCGKSTLLRVTNRLVPTSAGNVTVDGRSVADVDAVELRRHIGYAIQAVGLFAHMTVAQNVAVVPSLLGWAQKDIAARVDELLALVGLDPVRYRGRRPRELSGGEAQRVGVARAIAGRPRALLMDEPFGAVDALVRGALQRELARIVRELDTLTLFVTHDFDEALKLADRIVVMREGRVEQVAPPLELLERPATNYVRELVHAGDDVYRQYYLHVRDTLR